MATAAIYCTHKELKRVFPQLDSFDNKKQIYGWTEVSSNKYGAHNSGRGFSMAMESAAPCKW